MIRNAEDLAELKKELRDFPLRELLMESHDLNRKAWFRQRLNYIFLSIKQIYFFEKPDKIFTSSNVEFHKFVAWQIVLTKEPYQYDVDSDSDGVIQNDSENEEDFADFPQA